MLISENQETMDLLFSMSAHFMQIANAVTARTAELLCAPVFVTNHQGVIITSSEPQRVGRSLLGERDEPSFTKFLRIPIRHEAEMGEVIVGAAYNQAGIPSRLAQALVELVINQTIHQNHLPSQHELKNELIYDLLHDRIADETALLSRAKQLGMDLSQPRAVILIDAADYILNTQDTAEAQQRRAQVIISSIVSFFHLPSDTICAYLGQGSVCVLKASNTKNLDPWADGSDVPDGLGASWANLTALKRAADALLLRLRNDTHAAINIGIGRYHPGIQGLARSYEDARAALSLGSRFRGHNQIHCLGEMGIAAFVGVADEETKIDLAKYLLSPLDQDSELLMTLDTFFSENCCPSSTARRLSIHRNTLNYRLDKIASLTGLEPRKFDDAVQMRLSLLLRSLQST